MRVLPHARIPELPNPYFGKVRDCYDLAADARHPNGRRILIASDRISAFDRIVAAIPDEVDGRSMVLVPVPSSSGSTDANLDLAERTVAAVN